MPRSPSAPTLRSCNCAWRAGNCEPLARRYNRVVISRLLVLLVLAPLPAWSGAWDAHSVAGWVLRSGGAVRLAGGEYLRDLSLLTLGNLPHSGIVLSGTLVEPEQLDRI